MDRLVTALTRSPDGRPVAVWYNETNGGSVVIDPHVTGCNPADDDGMLVWTPRRIWTPKGDHSVAKGHIIDCARGPHDTVTVAVIDPDDATMSTASLDSDSGFCVWEGAYRHIVSFGSAHCPGTPPPPVGFRNPTVAYDVLNNAVVCLSDFGGKPVTVYKIDPSAGRVMALWPVADNAVVVVCGVGLLTLELDGDAGKLKKRPVMRSVPGQLTSAVVEHTDGIGVCAMTFAERGSGRVELWVLNPDLAKLVRDDRDGRWNSDAKCLRVQTTGADQVYTELAEPPATVVQHVSIKGSSPQVRSVVTSKLV